MDREIWNVIVHVTRRLRRRRKGRGRKPIYSDALIMRLYLWATWNGRGREWACQRDNLPRWYRPRQLPSSSQIYRRTSKPAFEHSLQRVMDRLAAQLPPAQMQMVDGKPLTISENSRDPDARDGRAERGFGKGYKLHALVDELGVVRGCRVTPLNESEHRVAIDIAQHVQPNTMVLGDGNYDSAPLYQAFEAHQAQLVTPLRGMASSPRRLKAMPASRRRVINWWQNQPDQCMAWKRQRDAIERTFGHMVTVGGGLILPAFVRRLHRVRQWVLLKTIIHNARRICRFRQNKPILQT